MCGAALEVQRSQLLDCIWTPNQRQGYLVWEGLQLIMHLAGHQGYRIL
jgi:hypothetical protein